MNSRDEFLKKFRGDALGKIDSQSSLEEYFQNTTLRPILKLQNDLILSAFQIYIVQNKIPFEVVPGITSAIAAAAYAGIPITHRSATSTLTFITGHEDPTKNESNINWKYKYINNTKCEFNLE